MRYLISLLIIIASLQIHAAPAVNVSLAVFATNNTGRLDTPSNFFYTNILVGTNITIERLPTGRIRINAGGLQNLSNLAVTNLIVYSNLYALNTAYFPSNTYIYNVTITNNITLGTNTLYALAQGTNILFVTNGQVLTIHGTATGGGGGDTNWQDIAGALSPISAGAVVMTNASAWNRLIAKGAFITEDRARTLVLGTNVLPVLTNSFLLLDSPTNDAAQVIVELGGAVSSGQWLLLLNDFTNKSFTVYDNSGVGTGFVNLQGDFVSTNNGSGLLLVHNGFRWNEIGRFNPAISVGTNFILSVDSNYFAVTANKLLLTNQNGTNWFNLSTNILSGLGPWTNDGTFTYLVANTNVIHIDSTSGGLTIGTNTGRVLAYAGSFGDALISYGSITNGEPDNREILLGIVGGGSTNVYIDIFMNTAQRAGIGMTFQNSVVTNTLEVLNGFEQVFNFARNGQSYTLLNPTILPSTSPLVAYLFDTTNGLTTATNYVAFRRAGTNALAIAGDAVFPDDAAYFFNGKGRWSVPSGGGSGSLALQTNSANLGTETNFNILGSSNIFFLATNVAGTNIIQFGITGNLTNWEKLTTNAILITTVAPGTNTFVTTNVSGNTTTYTVESQVGLRGLGTNEYLAIWVGSNILAVSRIQQTTNAPFNQQPSDPLIYAHGVLKANSYLLASTVSQASGDPTGFGLAADPSFYRLVVTNTGLTNRTITLGSAAYSNQPNDIVELLLEFNGGSSVTLSNVGNMLMLTNWVGTNQGDRLKLNWNNYNAKWEEQWRFPPVFTNLIASSGGGDSVWTNDATILRPITTDLNQVAFTVTNAGGGLWITNRAPEVNLVNTNATAARARLRLNTSDGIELTHVGTGSGFFVHTNGPTEARSVFDGSSNVAFVVSGPAAAGSPSLMKVDTNANATVFGSYILERYANNKQWLFSMTTADTLSIAGTIGPSFRLLSNGVVNIDIPDNGTNEQALIIGKAAGTRYAAVATNGMPWWATNRFAFNTTTNIWPLTNGLNGQKLTVDGSKNLYWSDDATGAGGLTTNANQLLGVPLSIKDGALVTNLVTYSGSAALTAIPQIGIGTNSFQVLDTNLNPVVFVMSNSTLVASNIDVRGALTNQTLSASKIILSSSTKTLVSSAFTDTDFALANWTNIVQLGSATLTNLANNPIKNYTNAITAIYTNGVLVGNGGTNLDFTAGVTGFVSGSSIKLGVNIAAGSSTNQLIQTNGVNLGTSVGTENWNYGITGFVSGAVATLGVDSSIFGGGSPWTQAGGNTTYLTAWSNTIGTVTIGTNATISSTRLHIENGYDLEIPDAPHPFVIGTYQGEERFRFDTNGTLRFSTPGSTFAALQVSGEADLNVRTNNTIWLPTNGAVGPLALVNVNHGTNQMVVSALTANTITKASASGQLTSVANSTGMLTNNGSGIVGWLPIPTANTITTNVVYVSATGNDATALRNSITFPYGTLTNAVANALSGDTVQMLPGYHYIYTNEVRVSNITLRGWSVNSTFIKGDAGLGPSNFVNMVHFTGNGELTDVTLTNTAHIDSAYGFPVMAGDFLATNIVLRNVRTYSEADGLITFGTNQLNVDAKSCEFNGKFDSGALSTGAGSTYKFQACTFYTSAGAFAGVSSRGVLCDSNSLFNFDGCLILSSNGPVNTIGVQARHGAKVYLNGTQIHTAAASGTILDIFSTDTDSVVYVAGHSLDEDKISTSVGGAVDFLGWPTTATGALTNNGSGGLGWSTIVPNLFSAGNTNATHIAVVQDGTNTTGGIKTISAGANVTITAEGSTNLVIDSTGASGTPGGNSGAIQFAQGTTFAGTNRFTYDRTNEIMTLTGAAAGAIKLTDTASGFAFLKAGDTIMTNANLILPTNGMAGNQVGLLMVTNTSGTTNMQMSVLTIGTGLSLSGDGKTLSASGMITTNANQFLGAPLSIKDGALLTNANVIGTLTATNAQVNGLLAAADITLTNQLTLVRADLKSIVANKTNLLDFNLNSMVVLTNSLATNSIYILTNTAVGKSLSVYLYGSGIMGGTITNAWQITFQSQASGTNIYWPIGSTNGSYDILLNSNQVTRVDFTIPRTTNIWAQYTIYQ